MRRNSLRIAVIAAIIILAIFLLQGAVFAADKVAKVKNVIIFIGDGMGAQQRRAAAIVQGNGNPDNKLIMESFPVAAVVFNHCTDKIVTDSAASATAIATGHKTNYGTLSQSPDGKTLKTILEICRDTGMSTGLITTVPITHATPAAFASHVDKRSESHEIAVQLLKDKVDVLLGGGQEDFFPKDVKGGKRPDSRNLIEESKKNNYIYVDNRAGLNGVDYSKAKKLIGLFSTGAMSFEIDRNKKIEPSLAEMTNAAIKILSKNQKGFFLMVEGGKIDWACHGHDVAGAIYDTLALDEAIKVGVDFAKKDPATLIIVVNDHETGGFAITANIKVKAIKNLKATTEKMVGMIKKDGSNLDSVVKTYAGIDKLSDKERGALLDEITGRTKYEDEWGYGGSVLANMISARTGIHFSTGGHTGGPVILVTKGPGAAIFCGYYHQTEISKKILKLLGVNYNI